ncbi:Protein kinase, catalytic domain-containing protein [Artemisia annua]|uniref:Protein kinase, catalytic domain-containing protein n=1 Tax=Artemisia annua TaxID=35608 RepID=A0A2U1KST5_ARTAN|nr:Protein kinase, catalytic domain-containing protein [Artemisia annua]
MKTNNNNNKNSNLILKIKLLLGSTPSVPVIFLRRFSYNDIKRATDGFSRVIATSSHGASYKAKFQGGRVAVVKEIHLIDQEDDYFYREVQLLGRLHHRHVVALDGFSVGRKRFLVFENSENGSLKEHLNDPLKTPLDWRIRLKIIVGVAAALEYLHFFCDPPVYHVSISSSTIMLDENYNAKLSDVGLLGSGSNQVTAWRTSNCNGTTGQMSGNIMYQLGLLILELITGQSSDRTGADLSQWIEESCFPTSMDNMIDPDLGNNYNTRELKGLLAVARFCIKSEDKPNSFTPQIYRYLQRKVSILKI